MLPFDWSLVEQMRDTALLHAFVQIGSNLAPHETLFEDVMFGSWQFGCQLLNLQLTFEKIHDSQFWHLSISRKDMKEVDQQLALQVIFDILGHDGIMEMTHLMPPELQFISQFLKEEHRNFDFDKKEWYET
jgi:hypothetical protein